ncbi:MAG: alpha/beta fold hydrolase, partial [Shimia sp.]
PAAQAYLADRIHLVLAQGPAIEDDVAGQLAPGRLEGLTIPVDFIRGATSPPVTAAIHRGLMARLPNAVEHVIDGAGHMSPISHPIDVAALVAA